MRYLVLNNDCITFDSNTYYAVLDLETLKIEPILGYDITNLIQSDIDSGEEKVINFVKISKYPYYTFDTPLFFLTDDVLEQVNNNLKIAKLKYTSDKCRHVQAIDFGDKIVKFNMTTMYTYFLNDICIATVSSYTNTTLDKSYSYIPECAIINNITIIDDNILKIVLNIYESGLHLIGCITYYISLESNTIIHSEFPYYYGYSEGINHNRVDTDISRGYVSKDGVLSYKIGDLYFRSFYNKDFSKRLNTLIAKYTILYDEDIARAIFK